MKAFTCKCCGRVIDPYCADCTLVTKKQATAKLHIHKATLERLMNAGHLRMFRAIHRRVLLHRADVEKLLNSK